ncbi:phage holin family protein [Microbacter margulisiae]|uniref:Multisubunit Na+/H+ antiporter MnhB subunit n=1 Tax=Microbacter margulisiae TaxID=1350067 RepID=A0A7W5H124_9PORP|nr:phage holin family protein [Microbacter margulisiae]MBB3185927.1 multisubunit Na+/H+ antiporter MnhB subunit [Microbacter margulisiae]
MLYLQHEPQWRCYLIAFLMIVFGVVFLFVLSWMGGFGGKSTLSWWWGTLILPYPLGWLLMIILLVRKGYKQLKKQSSSK